MIPNEVSKFIEYWKFGMACCIEYMLGMKNIVAYCSDINELIKYPLF